MRIVDLAPDQEPPKGYKRIVVEYEPIPAYTMSRDELEQLMRSRIGDKET